MHPINLQINNTLITHIYYSNLEVNAPPLILIKYKYSNT